MKPSFCAFYFLFHFFNSVLFWILYFYSTGTGNIVAIMIGNILGRSITDLIENGTEVHMNIAVASQHGPLSPFWIYIMSFIFFGITAIILGYFIVVFIRRFYQNQQLRIQQVRHLPAFISWPFFLLL